MLQQISRFSARDLAIRPSGAGQVKEVKVTNFMCHSNMKVEFHPHVNFISGPNGSGKSAILQALQFTLGVRAKQTGRNVGNIDYIKKGTEQATASVRPLAACLCMACIWLHLPAQLALLQYLLAELKNAHIQLR